MITAQILACVLLFYKIESYGVNMHEKINQKNI
jgi:hypothetical protein